MDERVRMDAQRAREQRDAQIEQYEEERRYHIAALVQLDAKIADLRCVARSSSPFQRVEPVEIFGETDGDAGFGD